MTKGTVIDMINKTARDITAYIEFLRREGYAASLGSFDAAFSPCLGELSAVAEGRSSVCAALLGDKNGREKCLAYCEGLSELAGEETIAVTCHAGVSGYAVPILHGGRAIAILRIMGYTLEETAGRGPSALSPDLPDTETVRSIATPLEYMLGRLYELCCEHSEHNTVLDAYRKSLIYIRDHYTEGISVADVAKGIGYSVSYFGYIFKKNRGISVNNYISELRLDRAAELLVGTAHSVSYVSERVGFGDANYFSTAFKARFGLSPRQYRERAKNGK